VSSTVGCFPSVHRCDLCPAVFGCPQMDQRRRACPDQQPQRGVSDAQPMAKRGLENWTHWTTGSRQSVCPHTRLSVTPLPCPLSLRAIFIQRYQLLANIHSVSREGILLLTKGHQGPPPLPSLSLISLSIHPMRNSCERRNCSIHSTYSVAMVAQVKIGNLSSHDPPRIARH